MSNKIQVASSTLPETITPKAVFNHPGDNGVQIANQQGGTINFFLPASNGAVYNAANGINTEYYNLFVVGDEAFNECSGLTKITFSYGLKNIGKRGFSKCTSLKEIILPDNLLKIGSWVFSECTSLVEIEFPENLEVVGSGAFRECTL